jgi:hypothetical protein
MIPLSDDDKKLLTEFLGECWHEWEVAYPNGVKDTKMYGHRCVLCKQYWPIKIENGPIISRTFTTWQDLGDLRDKLKATQRWPEFVLYVAKAHDRPEVKKNKTAGFYFVAWLINPAVFIPLVAEFLRKENP